jgi:hypothetical protein
MTRRRRSFHAGHALALGLSAFWALGCPAKARVDKEPAPSAEPVAASASALSPPGPRTIPTLVTEKLASGASTLYAVEGGIAVTDGPRVGMVTGEQITWVGAIPARSTAYAENLITSVAGRWPDLLAAVYISGQARDPMPTFFPLVGKGGSFVVGPGGSARISGIARVGETVFLAVDAIPTGHQIVPVRGPKLVRHLITQAEAGCKEGEVRDFGRPKEPALAAEALESSPAGTMLSLGRLCQGRGPAAEVWDKDGKTRIVDLHQWWKAIGFRPTILKGVGDELWAYSDEWAPVVLHYKDGEITALPELGWPIESIFVSPSGKLHAHAGRLIHRFEGGAWAPLAWLPETPALRRFAVDDKDMLWGSGAGVYRLRPGPSVPAPETCPTPFVHLFRASRDNRKGFTYPTTRKALSTFPEASALGLVEFGPEYRRRLGVMVASRAQGEALIAHLRATMKDEDPHFFCFAPKDPRKIPLDAGE